MSFVCGSLRLFFVFCEEANGKEERKLEQNQNEKLEMTINDTQNQNKINPQKEETKRERTKDKATTKRRRRVRTEMKRETRPFPPPSSSSSPRHRWPSFFAIVVKEADAFKAQDDAKRRRFVIDTETPRQSVFDWEVDRNGIKKINNGEEVQMKSRRRRRRRSMFS